MTTFEFKLTIPFFGKLLLIYIFFSIILLFLEILGIKSLIL